MELETIEQILTKRRERLIGGARIYAKADRSDPFAFNRAMTHINNGICEPFVDDHGTTHEAGYDAEAFQESRSVWIDGQKVEYHVVAYRNLNRP